MGKWANVGNLEDDIKRGYVEVVAPGRVRAAVGVTHNLGDFNGVRIDFALEDNVPEGKTLEEFATELYERAEELVGNKLGEYES